ncbi:Peptidase family M28 [Aquimarina amphilecti]|uniref:Vacuolar membrane protease n=1 Tax=Aquimarina amphilecti TaxID=1038014 RepID=A0A1H7VE20_AQUAM|nr:M28 family peptidase [Aquimarina amphilecti]SEM07155.1 Peptidase family M28 [Aquimarina amphilecti]
MKKILSVLTFICILFSVWYTFYSSMPQQISGLDTPEQEFSTLRALEHVKKISEKPHYLGSSAHEESKNYILEELKKLGLSAEVQEGFSIGDKGTMSKPQNIVAKIKGTKSGKALLLLSHYDSSQHSSYGASDAASGVATILESVRAYLSQNKTPTNDIIICITDGEELGLNGADLFVSEHQWAKDVGLVLNFEARGSGGNSFMLMETNGKNGKLIEEFIKADPEFPVTNSLAYSIYKLLPNDTDLTVFRKHGDIEGYNFAFIDDHFDYHTENDIWQNLDLNTLQHQGSYLMPLLTYFSDADITNLKSEQDFLYFNIPIFKIIKYPFQWIYPLLGIAIFLFIGLIIYGKARYRINFSEVGSGFLAFIISTGLAGVLGFGLWKLVLIIYPEYHDILHGFPYNGYYYIAGAVLLSVATFFKVYSIFNNVEELPSILVAPLFFWILICGAAAVYLKGASYFIIPVLLCLLCQFILINQKRPFPFLMLILCLPSIFMMAPFIATFPVALGLKITFASSVLTVLLCTLLLPIFGFYTKKSMIGTVAFIIAVVSIGASHYKSSFTEERQKPNSLVYILNEDKNKAYWASYDHTLDSWTKNYIDRLKNIAKDWNQNTIESKYSNAFNYVNEAPLKDIKSSRIETSFDSINGNMRILDLCIRPQRDINRMDLFIRKSFKFESLSANGVSTKDITGKDGFVKNSFTERTGNRLLTYHVRNNESLELRMEFHKDSLPEIVLYESSYDLLESDLFSIPKRSETMIPKPFILNDAITIKKTLTLEYVEKTIDSASLQTNQSSNLSEDNEQTN